MYLLTPRRPGTPGSEGLVWSVGAVRMCLIVCGALGGYHQVVGARYLKVRTSRSAPGYACCSCSGVLLCSTERVGNVFACIVRDILHSGACLREAPDLQG
jgi:hypothetical protein